MVNVIQFKKEHVEQIKQQDHDAFESSALPPEVYEYIEQQEHSYSIQINDKIVACAGLIQYWNHRGEVWAIIDRDAGKYFVSLVRAFKRMFILTDCKRIEAAVIKSFLPGHRLVQLLGFKLEAATMKAYGPKGQDYSLYARVRV